MENNSITKPSIQRLCKKAGVKSMSLECVELIKNIMELECDELIETLLSFNECGKTKTIMVKDIYKSIEEHGYKLSKSSFLGETICNAT